MYHYVCTHNYTYIYMTGPYWDATNLEIDLIIAELLEVQLISLSTCQDYVLCNSVPQNLNDSF